MHEESMRDNSVDPALVQEFLANSLSISAVRKMGPSGTLKRIRTFIISIDLAAISEIDASQFPTRLNKETINLQRSLPNEAKHWGVARKCLNLFFRDALYNFYLRKQYDLGKFEEHLEIPLDSRVGNRLRTQPEGSHLPRWQTVKGLKQNDSDKFQDVAAAVAKRLRTRRVHLDISYWRREN
jgi:hypothetical protein